jgi:hypothetical protein
LTWYFLVAGRDVNPRPAGCEDSAFCLSLGGDPFGAGQMRRQELSRSVQGGGRFVEDRVEGLEDVRHPGGDVEGDRDVGGGGLPGQADGVVEEDLVRSGLDDQGRQAGQVGEDRADQADSGVVSGRVVGTRAWRSSRLSSGSAARLVSSSERMRACAAATAWS